MKRSTYYHGQPGAAYGIWSSAESKFVYEIREDTPMLAMARLYQKIDALANARIFSPRQLPKGRE